MYITYPLKKVVRYFLGKIEMPPKSLALLTFITCLLILVPSSVLIYGVTMQCLYMLIGLIISQLHWLFLDFESLQADSKIIARFNSKTFRSTFGVFLAISLFIVTMSLFTSFDPYYITPLAITVFYMIFVYRRPKPKNVIKNHEIRP